MPDAKKVLVLLAVNRNGASDEGHLKSFRRLGSSAVDLKPTGCSKLFQSRFAAAEGKGAVWFVMKGASVGTSDHPSGTQVRWVAYHTGDRSGKQPLATCKSPRRRGLTHGVPLLAEMEAVVGDVGDVDDLGGPLRAVRRRVEQLDEGLDDDGEVLPGVVAAAVHLAFVSDSRQQWHENGNFGVNSGLALALTSCFSARWKSRTELVMMSISSALPSRWKHWQKKRCRTRHMKERFTLTDTDGSGENILKKNIKTN